MKPALAILLAFMGSACEDRVCLSGHWAWAEQIQHERMGRTRMVQFQYWHCDKWEDK